MDLDSESYARIIDNLHDGLYVIDKERVITYWNRGAERISGFTAKEVVGKSCASCILTHVDGFGRNLCLGLCPLTATIVDGIDRESRAIPAS